ncbi:unnamed protein product [Clonostachys rhizophaga]|uniref:Uncharacterized protein n=1 Tax=Clonostachys rhizophaga TaxID=160324 RepID=A0A9N9VFE6_9HYPO|nr:unnamed protein product [Clonostachys rhizophaga]
MAMEADRRDTRCAALRREIESYFDNPDPFPPPLPRSSFWLEHTYPHNYQIQHLQMFFLACQEGRLKDVEEWVRDRRDTLRPMGLRDGLDVAAMGSQDQVVRYFIEEVGVGTTGAAVRYACKNQSLLLFELFVKHGYHPNQTSGLLLDIAVEKHSFTVIKLLLEHGAEVRYSRPLARLIRYRGEYLRSLGLDDDWRPLIEMLLSYGADINAASYGGGTALSTAVHRGRLEVIEFLIQNGADGRIVTSVTKEDSFALAAKGAQVEWEITDELKEYLDYFCDSDSSSIASRVAPPGVDQNPLVKMLMKVKTKRDQAGGQHDRK